MKKPKMIIFDYGQTLVDEAKFDGEKGIKAVLKYAVKNKYSKTAQELQAVANFISAELGRNDVLSKDSLQIEIPNTMFSGFLYESQGIELSIKGAELDKVFWDAAAPGVATPGIGKLLDFLKQQGIRTAVLCNTAFSRDALAERIKEAIPNHEFEFIQTSSEYMYRKPNHRFFELALEKADLKPDQVWYAGDDFESDVEGAKSVGIFPVWYVGASAFPKERKSGILTVDNWDKLKWLMEE